MADEDVCPDCGHVMRLHSQIAGCPRESVEWAPEALDAWLGYE